MLVSLHGLSDFSPGLQGLFLADTRPGHFFSGFLRRCLSGHMVLAVMTNDVRLIVSIATPTKVPDLTVGRSRVGVVPSNLSGFGRTYERPQDQVSNPIGGLLLVPVAKGYDQPTASKLPLKNLGGEVPGATLSARVASGKGSDPTEVGNLIIRPGRHGFPAFNDLRHQAPPLKVLEICGADSVRGGTPCRACRLTPRRLDYSRFRGQ